MKRRLILVGFSLVVLVATFYGAWWTRHKKKVNDSLQQVFDSKTDQRMVLGKLREMGAKATPFEVEALTQANEVGSAAELALLNNPHARESLPDILRLLEHKNPEVRARVASVIEHHIRPQDTFALPTLIITLSDPDSRVREETALALSKFGPAATTAVPALAQALDDSSTNVRIMAAMALFEIDNNQTALTIPVLKEAITNSDARNRHWAAVYLHRIDSTDAGVLPVFIGSLTNDDSGIRISAAYSLRPYGGEAKAAVPALLNLLHDSDAEVRKAVRAVLGKIDPEALKTADRETNVQNR